MMNKEKQFGIKKIRLSILMVFLLAIIVWAAVRVFKNNPNKGIVQSEGKKSVQRGTKVKPDWKVPDESTIPAGEVGNEIRYGKELIAHTSVYLGPKGKVARMSNGMNCQNCHSDAGTKPYAFNFSAVSSTYPQFKTRSESWISIAQRINSCFVRSLNGQALDTTGKEMKALIAYIQWLGKDVPKGITPAKTGVVKLPYMDHAADPAMGKVVYATCQVCHGKEGGGQLNSQGTEYVFPPLWGNHSFNDGAGLYRLANFAGFVKDNMPFGTNYNHPVLSDEEAWDVAAYVNSEPRPHKDQSKDYSHLGDKPIDFPFGPYADNFSEKQHKYGPFQPIVASWKND